MSGTGNTNDYGQPKAWVITADMGLGHQRAAHPLAYMAEGGIITAGSPEFTDPGETRLWHSIRALYEFISRSRAIPIVGPPLFAIMNSMLRIPTFYPLRDLSTPAPNNHIVDYLIRRGLGKTLMARLSQEHLPIIATFYAPALIADHYQYKAPIYSVICDADLNRIWVATKPGASRIFYFAPCGRVMRRLREYGVPDERIFITGFPLPRENIGGPRMEILKTDLLARLRRLDPKGRFIAIFKPVVEQLLGPWKPLHSGSEPVTLTFAVGGAGAQVEIGQQLASSLKKTILDGSFRLILLAGVNRAVERDLAEYLTHIGLTPDRAPGVQVICEDSRPAYFDRFNQAMRITDILWTKPSELSFYSALGIPIVMAPTIGAQEDKNRKWLMDKSCALPQYNPNQAFEWLGDMLQDGILAEKALNGFIKNRKLGVYKIEEVFLTGSLRHQYDPLLR
ncbi:MAG: hypothetical protein A2W25_17010 [candidate division Zixibacteria bacterium RBG_16_53_22]|nr:MAG: hypothetical protein A2W25_17010 [candidate division Zixibacteria bacterium RBG_16_53_22]